jgi:signal peptidase I
VWLAPRQTIDRILVTRPRHLVWLLASLGTISGFAADMIGLGATGQLLNWRMLLGLIVAGAVTGIVLLYPAALVFKWIGRLLGGHASTLELRAVLAWSTVPIVFSFILVLAVLVALKFSAAPASNHLSLALRVIVALCGLWSFIVFLLMFSRVQGFGLWRAIAAYVLGLIFPFLIAMLVRALLFQPFNTPSNSMAPTLLTGDYFFVAKYSYGYSHYSIPFAPRLFTGRIFGSEPARGDVVVFRFPKDGVTDYVKRVVGLPGDRIQMRQGLLYINDVPVTRERLPDFIGSGLCGSDDAAKVKHWRETLPNGVSHETLDCLDDGFYDNTGVFTVPAGQLFMMGDNRDNSSDSRIMASFGYIPFENLIGRVTMIYFSSTRDPAAASERAGTMVH